MMGGKKNAGDAGHSIAWCVVSGLLRKIPGCTAVLQAAVHITLQDYPIGL